MSLECLNDSNSSPSEIQLLVLCTKNFAFTFWQKIQVFIAIFVDVTERQRLHNEMSNNTTMMMKYCNSSPNIPKGKKENF